MKGHKNKQIGWVKTFKKSRSILRRQILQIAWRHKIALLHKRFLRNWYFLGVQKRFQFSE